jgi:hypothetical protein
MRTWAPIDIAKSPKSDFHKISSVVGIYGNGSTSRAQRGGKIILDTRGFSVHDSVCPKNTEEVSPVGKPE